MTLDEKGIKIYDYNEKSSENNSARSTKYYYVLHHFLWGCKKIAEQYVYGEKEILSDKVQEYVCNHRFEGHETDVYRFESKRWTIDQVVHLEESNGWSPVYLFAKNGFKLVGEIDLIDMFDGNPKKATASDGGIIVFKREFTYERPPHNLKEKKDEIEKELKKYNYENRNLIIFRTFRSSAFAYWDDIVIFSERKLPLSFYRLKNNLGIINQELKKFLNSLRLLKSINQMD